MEEFFDNVLLMIFQFLALVVDRGLKGSETTPLQYDLIVNYLLHCELPVFAEVSIPELALKIEA